MLTRVLEVRPSGDGNSAFVRLDLNAGDVGLEEHGVHLDPVVIPADGSANGPGSAYLIGNLCLEADFISRRKIWFRSMTREDTGWHWQLDDEHWPVRAPAADKEDK